MADHLGGKLEDTLAPIQELKEKLGKGLKLTNYTGRY